MTFRGHAGEPEPSASNLPDEEVTDELWWDTGTLADSVAEVLEESEASGLAYLRESWLAATMGLLRDCRRRAGLTQAEVADRLGTQQPSIARLERAGDTTLGRFWDYLSACGQAPLEIEAVSVSALRQYALADADAPRGASEVQRWLHAHEEEPAILPGTGQTASYQWLAISPELLKEAALSMQRVRSYYGQALSLFEAQAPSHREFGRLLANITATPTAGPRSTVSQGAASMELFGTSATDRRHATDVPSASKSQSIPAVTGSRAANEHVAA